MGKVVTSASVSLDGYIAGPEESGFEHLFTWYDGGETEFPSNHPDVPFNLSEADHAYLTEFIARVGVLVVGRHLFDMTERVGWHPSARPAGGRRHAPRAREVGRGPPRHAVHVRDRRRGRGVRPGPMRSPGTRTSS